MIHRLSVLAVALAAGGLVSVAQAQSAPEFRFSGFGTIAGVHSSEDRADFVGSSLQPTGAGATDDGSFAPDSRLGVQGSAIFGPKLSAVLQLVSQQNADDDWVPHVEWANLKWQVTPELALRVGRTALPALQLSETRLVGYANTAVRPAQEIYRIVPITSNDGFDLTWRKAFGGATHNVQAFVGRKKDDLPTGEISSDLTWGIADTVEIGDLSLRAGYTAFDVEIDATGVNGLKAGIADFAAAAAPVPSLAARARALGSAYEPDELRTGVLAIGFAYDPGAWFASGEAVRYRSEGLLADTKAWQLMAGRRIGAFTPYVGYARIKADIDEESALPATGIGALDAAGAQVVAGINRTLQTLNGSQKTATVGLRWDFMRNVALKAQYDRTTLDDGSLGRLTNFEPDFVPGGNFELFTVAVDFVF